jgi:hypothetical protein
MGGDDRPERFTLGRILALPLVGMREDWRREDGRPSTRPHRSRREPSLEP